MSSPDPTNQSNSYDFETILQLCRQRLSSVVTTDILTELGLTRAELFHKVACIIKHNLDSGRAIRNVSAHPRPTKQSSSAAKNLSFPETALNPYIDRVFNTYRQEYQRIERLAAGDAATWQTLLDALNARANYLMRVRWHIKASQVEEEASELVQETSLKIYLNRFPYDVPFTAWANKILYHRILERYTRSRDLIDRRTSFITSIDRPIYAETEETSWIHESLSDASSEAHFAQHEIQEFLLQAIDCLPSTAQKQVINFTYFRQLTNDEIAARLEISKGAVYNLRHRALQNLRHSINNE